MMDKYLLLLFFNFSLYTMENNERVAREIEKTIAFAAKVWPDVPINQEMLFFIEQIRKNPMDNKLRDFRFRELWEIRSELLREIIKQQPDRYKT